MHRAYLTGLLAMGLSGSLAAQPATTQVSAESGPISIDRTTQTEDVKFQTEAYDRMTVPVLLSGTGPYRFLVDTGADRTAISTEIASQLQLAPGQKASLHSVAGVTRVTTATVPSLQLTRKPVRIALAVDPFMMAFNHRNDILKH
jgi:predicted aspartyl protease